MAHDIEGAELKYGDQVVIPFTVVGTHGDAIALQPLDREKEKHPTVTYTARLCKKTERQTPPPFNEGPTL